MADFWLPTWKSMLLGLRCCSWGLMERWKTLIVWICIEISMVLRASRLSNPSNQGPPQTAHQATPPTHFAVWASLNVIESVFRVILWTCLKPHYLPYSSHIGLPMNVTFPNLRSPRASSNRGWNHVGAPMALQVVPNGYISDPHDHQSDLPRCQNSTQSYPKVSRETSKRIQNGPENVTMVIQTAYSFPTCSDCNDLLHSVILRQASMQNKHLLHVQPSKFVSPNGGPSSKLYIHIHTYK